MAYIFCDALYCHSCFLGRYRGFASRNREEFQRSGGYYPVLEYWGGRLKRRVPDDRGAACNPRLPLFDRLHAALPGERDPFLPILSSFSGCDLWTTDHPRCRLVVSPLLAIDGGERIRTYPL